MASIFKIVFHDLFQEISILRIIFFTEVAIGADLKVAGFKRKDEFLTNTGTTVYGLQACQLKRSSFECAFPAFNLNSY